MSYMAEQITKQEIEGLLSEQTKVILGAVDERFQKVDEQFQKVDERFQKVDERFQRMEGVFDAKLQIMEQHMDEKYAKEDSVQQLSRTLDNFLKRLTDREEEFTLLKADVAQIKAVLKEKLGVEILIQGR